MNFAPANTTTVAANQTITRFMNLGLFSTAASCVQRTRVDRGARFMLVPSVAVGPGLGRSYRSEPLPPTTRTLFF